LNNSEDIKALYQRYLDNNYTAEELDELLEYFYNSDGNHELNNIVQHELEIEDNGYQSHSAVQSLLNRLDHDLLAALKEREKPVKTVRLWYRIAAAASICIVLGLAMLFYVNKQGDDGRNVKPGIDIAPGKNTATLVLPNGKTINLSDAKTGIVIDASKLTYNDGSVVSSKTIPDQERASKQHAENLTVSTPRGGQYRIVLPDGTQVLLNAASLIKFPSNFAQLKERRVELIGEAYFEVTKNMDKPFIVKSMEQEVQVLGTHFNVNAYSDEKSIKTTLIEGSVRVSGNKKQIVLMPNQQAVFGDDIRVKNVDVESEIAWKNGDFVFDSDDLESIMRKISRWYDVEVFYDGKPDKEMHFGGIVSRAKNISAVLKIMQSTGQVSFKVQGRKITVIQN
jgi:transmembrane sensor